MNNKLLFIAGPHGGGKTTYIYEKMIEAITDTNGNIDLSKKAYLVVPEQDTKEKQKGFMDYKGNKSRGMLNCDVVSFDRICHMVFSKLNINDDVLNIIQDDMKALLCQIAIERRSSELPTYKRKARKIGFSQKIASALSEFATYKIDKEKIDAIQKDNKVQQTIKDELTELLIVQDEFNSLLDNTNLNIVENKLKILSENIDKVDIFDNATLFFDGFTGFSPLQKEVFEKIKNKANQIYVSIDYREKELNLYLSGKFDKLQSSQKYENNIFHISDLFMESICEKDDIKDSLIIVKDGIEHKYDNSNDLKYLEENLFNDDIVDNTVIVSNNVIVKQNKDLSTELEWTINQIIEKTRITDNPISYNDIKIIVPNIENYRDIIISKFEKYNIPIFIDDSQSIFYSPYVKAVRAFVSILDEDFSYESLMGYMNTGLYDKDKAVFDEKGNILINEKSIYYFDNAIRMFGVNHYRALSKNRAFLRNINRYIIKESGKKNVVEIHANDIYKVYENLVMPIMSLYEKNILKNKEKQFSLSEFVALIRDFINETKLDTTFENYLENLQSVGAQHRKPATVGAVSDRPYGMGNVGAQHRKPETTNFPTPKDLVMLEGSKTKISDILDLLEKIGKSNIVDNQELKYSLQELSQILDSAIDIFKVKSIPYSMDQIVVGDLMRSRFDNPKVLFFLGMNDSALPAKRNDDNIINDKMREAFTQNNIQVSQSLVETTYNSRFYTYLALTNPSEKLYLSYTNMNSTGESDYKSRFLLDVEEMFANNVSDNAIKNIEYDADLPIYDIKQMKEYISLHNAENTRVLNKIDEYINQYKDLSKYKKDMIRNAVISKAYYDLLKEVDKNNSENDNKTYKNITVRHTNVDKNSIAKLYEDGFVTSATAMEKYASCPYKYFLENMIGLSERETNEIDARNIGNIFHNTIEKFFENGNHYPNVVGSPQANVGATNINNVGAKQCEPEVGAQQATVGGKQSTGLFTIDRPYGKANVGANQLDNVGAKQCEPVPDQLREEIYTIAQSAIDNEFESQAKVNDLKSQQFLIERLKEIIYVSITHMLKQLKYQAPLVSIYHELPFDDYPIGENNDSFIRGRIDQVELLQEPDDGNVLYIKIVDYKSSTKTIDKNKIDKGQMIQFVIYLDYVKKALDNKTFIDNVKNNLNIDASNLNKYKRFELLGTFYKSILDNIITIKKKDFDKFKKNLLKNIDVEIDDREIFKQYVTKLREDNMKMTGIVNISDDKFKVLDSNAKANKNDTASGEKIDNANTDFVSLKPDGAISLKYDNEFNELINQVRETVSEEITNIKSGSFPVSPKDRICDYCAFVGSCGLERYGTEEDDSND